MNKLSGYRYAFILLLFIAVGILHHVQAAAKL